MPLWLDILFASLTSLNVICSIIVVWRTAIKNRTTIKTVVLQDITFDEGKYDYENDNLCKHWETRITIYNNTNHPLLISQCTINNDILYKRISTPNGIGTEDIRYDKHFGLQINPISSCELVGVLKLPYNITPTKQQISIMLSNNKKLKYANPQKGKQ